MKVRLAGIVNESVTDGPGLRIVVFFQGCKHHCPGCHNPHTWDALAGTEYEFIEVMNDIEDTPLIKGITLSGGDPFYQPESAAEIAREFHSRGKDVWAYTGFVWKELLEKGNAAASDLISQCDVIVDGPYIQALRNPKLEYRGSDNQRIIRVKESLQQGKIVEWVSDG
jgi:anaerobic ribonucleoside-triphosphate reductase activating protein